MQVAEILIEPGKNDYLYVRLPNRWLILSKVDFSRAALVFEDTEGKPITHLRPIQEKELQVLGLDRGGNTGVLRETIPLAELVRRRRAEVEKDQPFRLKGDDWYLSARSYDGEVLTNGSHYVRLDTFKPRFECTKGKPRAIVLDPIGLSKDGTLLIPLSQAVAIIEREEGALADPYAWTKRFTPAQRGGSYDQVLVIR